MRTPAVLCAGLEIALNRTLRLEPAAVAACGELSGRRLGFETTDLGWRFSVEPESRGVRVSSGGDMTDDVTIRAPSTRLIALALRPLRGQNATGVGAHGVEISGDTELLQKFSHALALAGFDFEEWLAPLVGDGPAHRLAGGLQRLFHWARNGVEEMSYSGAEYLREETGDLARSGDVEDWLAGVETLRDGIDRLDARIAQLEQRT
ncbi:MAG TPA: SCP2 sterol-binding domain-containing protein [Rhodanobacteraceae bacterium]|nr:SCP2 sterol-binding domain-containing protein [Rhodanobacteraceae bacterium]